MKVNPRSSWTTRAMTSPTRKPTPYKGAAVHWPGLSGQLGLDTHGKCLDLLRSLEKNAVSGSYGAIPYQVAACLHGLTEGRTVLRENGANGGTEANLDYGSVVVLVGTADTITDAHKRHVRAALDYLNAPKLLTHNDVRPSPTACPGPVLTKWIDSGAPNPGPPPVVEDDPVKYLSLANPGPVALKADTWVTIPWTAEHSDDWSGHKDGAGTVTLPTSGIVAGGVLLTASCEASVRFVRGSGNVGEGTCGPGPDVLALPPMKANGDPLSVQVRAAIAGQVTAATLRLTHSARAK